MRSGFYVVVKDVVLVLPPHRIKLRRGDWLVTDGIVVGRFDKERELDWLPLEWVRGDLVLLDEIQEPKVSASTVRVPVSRLDASFRKLMFIEPGEPIPDLPLPTLGQLLPYLKARRTLVASYDYR